MAWNRRLADHFNLINNSKLEFFEINLNTDQNNNNNNNILNCWCIYPPNFDRNNKYPLILHVYGEPAAQIVRKQWQGKVGLWYFIIIIIILLLLSLFIIIIIFLFYEK